MRLEMGPEAVSEQGCTSRRLTLTSNRPGSAGGMHSQFAPAAKKCAQWLPDGCSGFRNAILILQQNFRRRRTPVRTSFRSMHEKTAMCLLSTSFRRRRSLSYAVSCGVTIRTLRGWCLAIRAHVMKNLLLVTASTLAFVSAAVAADLPTRQPPPPTPVVGKAPIGKAPIGKAPLGKGPVVARG